MAHEHTLHIHHNPVIGVAWAFLDDRRVLCGRDDLERGVHPGAIIRRFLETLKDKVNRRNTQVIYHGPSSMKEAVLRALANQWKWELLEVDFDYEAISAELKSFVNAPGLRGDRRNQQHIDYVKRQLDRRELRVAFVSNVPAGKSTIINALLGRDLLPTGPENGSTQCMLRIEDVDGMLNAQGYAFNDRDECRDVNEQLTKSVLRTWIANREIREIFVRCDLDWIDNIPAGRLVLFETPSLAGTARKELRTYFDTLLLGQDEQLADIVVYVMDETEMNQPASPLLTRVISHHGTFGRLFLEDRFVFVCNKVDALIRGDLAEVRQVTRACENYPKEALGLFTSTMYPLCSEAAFAASLVLNNQKLGVVLQRIYDAFVAKFPATSIPLMPALDATFQQDFLDDEDGDDAAKRLLRRSGLFRLQETIGERLRSVAFPARLNRCLNRLESAGLLRCQPLIADGPGVIHQLTLARRP